MMDEILTVVEAAQRLKVQPATMRLYARTGVVPAKKHGKSWVFDWREILQGYPNEAVEHGKWTLIEPAGLPTLPQVTKKAKSSGICFLWYKEKLIYIGSTFNLHNRVHSHDKRKKIIFDRATFLPIPYPWNLSVEAAYINKYRPIHNRMHTSRSSDG